MKPDDMKPDDVPEWAWREALNATGTPFLSDISRMARALIAAEQRGKMMGYEEAAKVADRYHEAAIKWAATYVKDFDGETDSKSIADAIRAKASQSGEKP